MRAEALLQAAIIVAFAALCGIGLVWVWLSIEAILAAARA